MRLSLLARCAVISAIVSAAGACQNFLDVNTNPNSPEHVTENLMLPSLTGIFSSGVIGSWPSSLSAEWMQQIAYNGTRANMRIELYEIFPSEADRLWNVSYDQVMNNARILSQQATADSDYAYAGIAEVIWAWDLSIVTDMWGPVPYSQAWDPTNPYPAYDTQQQVYDGVFKILNQGISDLGKASARVPGSDDLLYHGDLTKWTKLAYTLEAQLNLTLSTAPGENTQQRAQAALDAVQQGFASNADDADFQYFDAAGQRNPWNQSLVDPRIQMSKHYVDLLQSLNDPRLAKQASLTRADSVYRGEPNGGAAVDTATISSINPLYGGPAATLTWMSYADAKLVEAEALLIAQGPAAADSAYRQGVQANMQKLGVADSATQAYLASLPSLASSANPLSDIMTQKYIVNFLNYQVWDDWRRTGYPNLTPVPGALLPSIPVRFMTPGGELSSNADNVSATGIDPGLNGMTTRVWWDPN
ncbi:MAG TPA: SusD/RagB family nutrient-binding outer membrane lipoprotein [Gemmatimonadaceae bacterium]